MILTLTVICDKIYNMNRAEQRSQESQERTDAWIDRASYGDEDLKLYYLALEGEYKEYVERGKPEHEADDVDLRLRYIQQKLVERQHQLGIDPLVGPEVGSETPDSKK